MKLLRLQVSGLSLFKDDLDIMFYGTQNISIEDKETMYPLFSNIYLNCATVFIGKNASGKTTILQVLSLALHLLNNEPINHLKEKYVLRESEKVTMNIYFYSNQGDIYCLKSVIKTEISDNNDVLCKIVDEKLWKKPPKSVSSKKMLTDFQNIEPIQIRSGNEIYLMEDVSMMIAHNKKNKENITISNFLSYTNIHTLSSVKDIPSEIITFLDPTVERLYFEQSGNKTLIHLKFKHKEEILLNSVTELEFYLSSGTIKGVMTFVHARNILTKGGYLLIDELENHFNKEIVSTIVRLFMDKNFNKKGAVLVYTTHYPELLDEYNRNDSIYITENKEGLCVTNLSKLLDRNDIKKSDVYQSGMIAQTTPEYEAYMHMKKYMFNYISSKEM